MSTMCPAEALTELMSEISERCYCAGWLIGLEYELWAILIGESDREEYGIDEVNGTDLFELRRLSAECGGWIIWEPDPEKRPPYPWDDPEFERRYFSLQRRHFDFSDSDEVDEWYELMKVFDDWNLRAFGVGNMWVPLREWTAMYAEWKKRFLG